MRFTSWVGRRSWAGLAIGFLWIAVVSAQDVYDAGEKARVFVLTDISNEPDDEESLVRFLVYSNEYQVEGIVATTSTWLRTGTREDLIRRAVEAYGRVRPNLLRHADGYPTREELASVVATGQPQYGMAAVGDGKASAGSQLLLAAADREDPRPLWISVWGGANTLAQALWDARRERSPEELARLVSRLRVYTISDQDDAGPWLRREFPELFYIVSPSTTDWKEYWRATWTGISGDRHYRNGPFFHFHLVDNPWLEENIIRNHGPLGALYPKLAIIMEGDTPSFLGLIDNGLAWRRHPGWGGWGGRYVLYQAYGETRPIWTNNHDSRDTIKLPEERTVCSDQATIWRWRKHFQHDFAARMDWCVAERFEAANHNPTAVLNGDTSKEPVRIQVPSGGRTQLSSYDSTDPDGDNLRAGWFIYPEAGTCQVAGGLSSEEGESVEFEAPTTEHRCTVHIILQLEDDGQPSLVAYRRAVVEVQP